MIIFDQTFCSQIEYYRKKTFAFFFFGMKVNFVYMSKREVLHIEPDTKLSDIYTIASQKSCIPEKCPYQKKDQFLLLSRGMILDRERTIESYQLTEDDEIVMSVSFFD